MAAAWRSSSSGQSYVVERPAISSSYSCTRGVIPARADRGAGEESGGYELFRDDWGIPHLRAADALALARAQGHATALDRAWQLETERHRVLGTSASHLGAEAVDWDRFVRRARIADTARRCFDRLAPETATWVTAYADGVNEGLAEGAERAPEFAAVGLAPGRWEPWTPLGVWLSTHILFAGFPTKLWREEVARRLGEDRMTLFATDGPGTAGSNGWLLTGARTATGAPLLAGDPHRFIEDPGVYQQIRLACPEFDVVGLAVPGIPGIAHFGHTGHVAWAITNAMADYQDLYRERLRRTPDGGVEALGPDGWYRVHAHTETIEVAGAAPEQVEVIETDRGPVIIDGDPGAGETISLRYPPRVTGELGFDVLPALLRARTVADVDTALDRWVEPVNVVLAADTAGSTLHRVAGHVPVRPYANRLRVVPAEDPAYAWRDGETVPLPRTEVDGPAGIAVMANERGLAAPLGVEFAPPHRARRIRELLGADTDWTPDAQAAVHTDTLLASSRQLLSLLAWAPALGPAAERLRVVVADDNPVVRAGLGVLLSGRADIQVVAEAADGREAYERTLEHRPDVVLLDVRMPGVDGISALPHLVGIAPVLMLTYSRESEIVHEALRLGAGGYLVHGEFTANQLVQAVRDTKDGRANFTVTAADALLAHMRHGTPPQRGPLPEGLGSALATAPAPPPAHTAEPSEGLSQLQPVVGQSSVSGGSVSTPNRQQYGLSSREVEVMDLIASGMSNQQIAATCFISEKTVKNHINRIFTKLHSATRSEAIAHWLGTAPRNPGRQP
ncbi:penicillin acylase family protein [Streptomyces sp. 7G]|nr:penicillin acylase family protein [Streptomyces sp. 7G]MCA1269165.1 penicillin acylase family protein [Streptomyces sp. 7G]